ncbi:AAA family ATPase [Sorangium sp. So ce1000]|uniref:AAA family ATPase n=1 Tax=Sorangium sp. So ce1000 TaxID=3133325 RepID=UPI003F6456E0
MLDLPSYTLAAGAYEGSETVLFRGYRDADGARVAVKVTGSEFPTARQLGRLRREFAILNHLRDLPGVVRAYALEKCGRGLALVMEDLGACSLHDLLLAQRLDLEAALQIGIAVAATLEALHQRQVIHKDIKPHNIMLEGATRAPRLVDFGISARLVRESVQAARPGVLEGTLAYLSPEQTGRMNRAVDLRTDLYSLGVTLYELLTGELPFTATDPMELVHSHIARTPTPPHELASHVPRAVSAVVMKLLAKVPEERYQSARGLLADLDRCLGQWQSSGQISRFPLGEKDVTGELRIPQKLYGREQDVEALMSAFARVRKDAVELILISGYAGVGKSALVDELHKPIAREGGALVRGKFDPLSRDNPLGAVAHALRELVRQILAEPAAVLEAWKSALVEAIGPNGRLLFDLIPELELIVGPQPEVPALGPAESKNRFELLVVRFVRVFATATHPLALFLDDLQWADPASLRVLSLLLGDPESKHLLLLGAYRDSEVDATHPLRATLDELRKAGAALTELTLRPLDGPTVTALLAETLRASERELEPLSALVFDKTRGNPFFVSQFLGVLHDERLLWFDAATGAFRWDIGRIQEAKVTDNVVDLMLGKLHRLTPRTQRALSLAACIGHAFDLGTLAIIDERSPADTAAELWEALREGLVVPQGGDYRLLDVSGGLPPGADALALQISYRFLHDRVREAAYGLIPEGQKVEVHLSIGRHLWARSGQSPRAEDLLEIVRHLRLAAGRLTDAAERIEVARLHLRAGRKAKAATAYQAAADHFAAGIELLGPGSWTSDHALSWSLHIEGAESAYLSGALERADALFDMALPRASSSLERARIHNLRVILYQTLGKHAEAVKAGLAGLSCLGVTLPETAAERQAAFARGLAEVAAALQGRRAEDLLDAKVVDDPALDAVLQLIADMVTPIYHAEPDLYVPSVLKFVQICLEHGHSNVSAFGYMAYGYILTAILGRPAEGLAFGRLAFALNDKFPNPALVAKLNSTFTYFVCFTEPFRAALPYIERGLQAALACGDFIFFAINCFNTPMLKFGAGCALDELRSDVDRSLVFMQRIRDVMATGVLTAVKQVLANLQGRTRSRHTLSDESFDEDSFAARLDEQEPNIVSLYYCLLRLQVHFLHGEHEAVLAVARKAEPMSAIAAGNYFTAWLHFHPCLSWLALPAAETAEEEARREAAVARHRAEIERLAATCPRNYQHQLLLIEAESARRAGKHDEAMTLYDQAIALAKQNEFAQDEALANELCARMYLALGRVGAARGYLDDAYLGYLHWGASAKAEDLARDHGHLLPSLAAGRGRRRPTTASSTNTTMGTTILGQTLAGSLRDAALVVRAAQAIAGESTLPKVIEQLAKIVLESAGAEHGALLLDRGGQLFVEATFGVSPKVLEVGPSRALGAGAELCQSVALFVARTREPVVVNDARQDGRFAADPHLAAGGVQSILCLPLVYQDRPIGLLYLENKTASAAFHAARVELLELVSSQAAIAIENARLLAEVREANETVRQANERLEAEVSERTEELRVSNQEIGAANERLQIELRQREQAERDRAALQEQMIEAQRERVALQEQMIEAQRARLSELSTPLIPITDRIMVMPLIGTVDAERAEQVLEAALSGAQRHQASVVILDVTGIKQIDTHVIRTLLRTASALRLLGTRAVLTGIRSEVAQTMVQLGADLGAIFTKGTLQSGIAYALQLSSARGS